MADKSTDSSGVTDFSVTRYIIQTESLELVQAIAEELLKHFGSDLLTMSSVYSSSFESLLQP